MLKASRHFVLNLSFVYFCHSKGGFKDTQGIPVPPPPTLFDEVTKFGQYVVAEVQGIFAGKQPDPTFVIGSILVIFTFLFGLIAVFLITSGPGKAGAKRD